MTKEILKQEAEEYAETKGKEHFRKFYNTNKNIAELISQVYIDSAEPREKRIAELEAQIEKMKCCENCKHHYWAGGADLCCRLRENECKDKIKLEKWEFES
ncbi:hypothetical protein [uncultured Treponema sp.]|uniref:hypothetical protein n=1 Tax=uncultured Treponema sp. TaxID=162155 RepID=UPI0025E408E3|nr:hypothetical protein [uncultured Treponema sp.]